MAEGRAPPPVVTAPAPRIASGVPSSDAHRVSAAVTQGIGDGLRAADVAGGGHLDLGNLSLRLPQGASSRDVARALERAVRDALQRRQR